MPLAELEERRVYYEEHGDGEPVLLINGLGADHTTWGLQTAFFSEHFRVIVFDNPGIGQTEGPRGPYTSALFADVAAGLLRFLGFERAHIVGASMGGLIAQQLAAVHVAEIGDVHRFTDPAHLCSWAGLTPTHRESDTVVHRGHITKQGSKAVRWAAIEAVQRHPTTAKISADKHRIEARRGKNIAKVAAARKLLTLVYYGLRDGHIRALDRPRAA